MEEEIIQTKVVRMMENSKIQNQMIFRPNYDSYSKSNLKTHQSQNQLGLTSSNNNKRAMYRFLEGFKIVLKLQGVQKMNKGFNISTRRNRRKR